MERILVVEDNKGLAKIIARRISDTLKFEVDIAHTLREAKLFLKKYNYFIALLDLKLPDSSDGEIVDYVLSKDTRVIILSGTIDKEFRESMLKKNIIDYVNKSGIHDLHYIVQSIQRLKKNQQHEILVVDDSMIIRKHIQRLLENLQFNVLMAADGEEALETIEKNPDISLVITDYHMPKMDGFKLIQEIRKIYKKEDLSVIALSSNSDSEINAMFLKHGANDYITKPFSKEEFSCRINNTIEALENLHIVTRHANRDFLTSLYNRRYFFSNMNKYIKETLKEDKNYAIAMIDIDFFKKINDTFGHDNGDNVIVELANILTSNTNQHDIVARFGGEEFCIVLKDIDKAKAESALNRLREKVEKTTLYSDKNEKICFTISIGAVMNSDKNLNETIIQADSMLYRAKQSGRNKVVFA